MSALSIRLPESLHEKAKELAKREGISINQLLTTALAEKISALMTEEYLEERARRGRRDRFRSAMEKVRSADPDVNDEL